MAGQRPGRIRVPRPGFGAHGAGPLRDPESAAAIHTRPARGAGFARQL